MKQYNNFLPGRGINISFGQGIKHSPSLIVQACIKLRCERVRLEFDSYHGVDDEIMAELIPMLTQSGIKVLGVLSPIVPGTFANLRHGDRYQSYSYHNTKAQFLQFCYTNIERYGTYVNTRQIRNEQNTRRFRGHQPSVDEYLDCVHNILTSIMPTINYIPGCVMGNHSQARGRQDAIHYTNQMLKKLVSSGHTLSGIAFHPYIRQCYLGNLSSDDYITKITTLIAEFHQAHPQHPLRITEFGISRRRTTISTQHIAETYIAIYQFCQKQNIPFFIWGLLPVDHGFHPRNPEQYFNLLDENRQTTALFDELVSAVNQLYALRT